MSEKVNQYNKDTYKVFTLRVNQKTDAETINYLQDKDSVNGYLLDLIHDDMYAGMGNYELVIVGLDGTYKHALMNKSLHEIIAYWENVKRTRWLKAAYIVRRVITNVSHESGHFTARGEIIATLTV